MKASTLFHLAALMTVGMARVCAQETASPTPRPTPPDPPFINETPEFSAWTIGRYTVPGLGSQPVEAVIRSVAAATKPDSVTSVIKTGQVRHETGEAQRPTGKVRHQLRKLKTGEQEDVWYERGSRVTMESIWKMPIFEGGITGTASPQGPDFPELSWIAAGNYVGTQEAQGTTYLVFETQVMQGNATQAKEYGYKLSPMFNRAFINADTRLPWLLQTGDALQRYVFQTPPTVPLEVPPEYQAMFDNYEKRKLESTRKPVAP